MIFSAITLSITNSNEFINASIERRSISQDLEETLEGTKATLSFLIFSGCAMILIGGFAAVIRYMLNFRLLMRPLNVAFHVAVSSL